MLASLGVLLLGVAVAALGDTRVNSGSDAGGKLATVVEMAESGLDGGSIGYWAESADPAGLYHPIVNTRLTDRGWVQATSSVMPLASSLGYRAGGSFGALWLSLLAIPAGALAAAALSRQMGAPSGVVAFGLIGAASPLGFYAADQWEHAPAVAVALWALVLLREASSRPQIAVLGLMVGVSVVLRREVVFVLLTFGIVELVRSQRRRWWRAQWVAAVLALSSALGLFVAVSRLDHRVLGQSLASRSATQLAGAGAELGQRASDTILTTVAQYPGRSASHMVLGVVTLLGIAIAALGHQRRTPRWLVIGSGMTILGIVLRVFGSGIGFVPGAFAVLPLTAAAPVLTRRTNRPVLWAAVGTTVLIVGFQWTGSLASQWGGRYLLIPAAVVAIVVATELEVIGWRQPVALLAIGATASISAVGLVWHVQRTVSIGESRDEIAALTAGDVVVSTHAHFPREIAMSLRGERWLRAGTLDDLVGAMHVAAIAAPSEQVWLLHPGSCEREPCTRTWEERGDGELASGWTSVEIHEVRWLEGGTYVLEAFAPPR